MSATLLFLALILAPVGDRPPQTPGEPTTSCSDARPGHVTTTVGLVLCESASPLALRADPSVTSRVLVAEVTPGSRAERAGFMAGDVIHRVARATVTDADAAGRAIDAHAGDGELLINFWRNGQPNLIRLFRE